jgi:hypothetical protein
VEDLANCWASTNQTWDIVDTRLTFNLAKLAPKRIKAAGIETAPMKAAVSVMNANGGLPSGANGTLVPLHPSTWTNSALSGEMIPQGIAIAIEIDTGVARPLIKMTTFLVQGVFMTDGTGVIG